MLRCSYQRITSNWIPVDDAAVHATCDDDLEQRVEEDLAHSAGVREAVRVERVQLLVQHHDGDLDACQDEMPRRRVVHRANEGVVGFLAQIHRDIDIGLRERWKSSIRLGGSIV